MTATSPRKGHWPKGRPRNDGDPATWPESAVRVCRLIENHRSPRVVSYHELARHLGVSTRAVLRWLSCEDLPPANQVARIEAWRVAVIDRLGIDRERA